MKCLIKASWRLLRWGPSRGLLVLLVLLVSSEAVYRFVVEDDHHPPGRAFDLYAVGGSTTRGEPYDVHCQFAFPQLIARLLGGAVQGVPIRVHNLAGAGETVYPQSFALSRRLRERDTTNRGAVLIYSGHNEWFNADDPPPLLWRGFKQAKQWTMRHLTWLGDLVLHVERRLNRRGRRDMYHYELYLRQMIENARAANTLPVLFTVAGNIQDMDPGIDEGYTPKRTRALLGRAEALRIAGRFWEAADEYARVGRSRELLRPYTTFQQAVCHRALGHRERARGLFLAAYDMRTNGFQRAKTAQNDLIRRLAAEYRIPLVDTFRLFEQASAPELPGWNLFADGHHPNARGVGIIARAGAKALARRLRLDLSIPQKGGTWWLTQRFGCSPEKMATVHLRSAAWLLSVSAQNAYVDRRLKAAKALVDRAAKAAPGDFFVELWRATVDAVGRGRLLETEAGVGWFAEHRLFFSHWVIESDQDPCFYVNDLPAVVKRYRDLGVPSAQLETVKRAAARWNERCAGVGRAPMPEL